MFFVLFTFLKVKFTYISGSLFGSILLLQCCPVSGKSSWHKVVSMHKYHLKMTSQQWQHDFNILCKFDLCCGSESTGSTCFWILLSPSKNSKKNLDSYCFVTSFGLFIFENDVNVPSKSNKQTTFLKRHGSADPDPNPDPHQNVMDPQHCRFSSYPKFYTCWKIRFLFTFGYSIATSQCFIFLISVRCVRCVICFAVFWTAYRNFLKNFHFLHFFLCLELLPIRIRQNDPTRSGSGSATLLTQSLSSPASDSRPPPPPPHHD